jgi:hypothetical protein
MATGVPSEEVVTLPTTGQAPVLPATQQQQEPEQAASATPDKPSADVIINLAPAVTVTQDLSRQPGTNRGSTGSENSDATVSYPNVIVHTPDTDPSHLPTVPEDDEQVPVKPAEVPVTQKRRKVKKKHRPVLKSQIKYLKRQSQCVKDKK